MNKGVRLFIQEKNYYSVKGMTMYFLYEHDEKYFEYMLRSRPTYRKDFYVDDKQIEICLQTYDFDPNWMDKDILKHLMKFQNGFILVFDFTDKSSFDSIILFSEILKEIDFQYGKPPIALIGKNCDQKSEISKEEVEKFATENEMHFFEILSDDYENADDAIRFIVTSSYHHYLKKE